jgi:hypothetical protein
MRRRCDGGYATQVETRLAGGWAAIRVEERSAEEGLGEGVDLC